MPRFSVEGLVPSVVLHWSQENPKGVSREGYAQIMCMGDS